MSKKSKVVSHSVEVRLDPTQASFTIPEVSRYTGLTHWQVRMSIWQGRLAALKVVKSLVILRTDVDNFLASLPAVEPNSADWLSKRNALRKAVSA